MNELLKYMSDPDEMDELARVRLKRMLKRYPWFGTARLLLDRVNRESDSLVRLRYVGRPLPEILLEKPTKAHFLGGKTLSVISQFFSRADTPKAEGVCEDNSDWASASVQEDPDLISEELAEIYLEQGFRDKARAIYAKLSLLYPEKSVYFAEIINRIDVESSDENVTV